MSYVPLGTNQISINTDEGDSRQAPKLQNQDTMIFQAPNALEQDAGNQVYKREYDDDKENKGIDWSCGSKFSSTARCFVFVNLIIWLVILILILKEL